MTRHYQLRLVALFAALLTLGILASPQRAAAQNDNCVCNAYTINVDLGVQCKVTVCVLDPYGARNCITIAPGTRGRIACVPGAQLGFVDCNGVFVPFTPGYDGCMRGIGVGRPCCTIDACWSPDAACVINVTPSILDVCPCL